MLKCPKVSVILATYNRNFVLCRTIEKIIEQDYPNFELIILDQTKEHDKETEDFLNANNKIRYFKIPTPSLPNARNIGIKKAKGDIILFLDDDVVPERDIIIRHVEKYSDESIGGVSGRILEENNKVHRFNKKIGYITIFGRNIGNRSLNRECFVKTAFGGNMSFRADCIKSTGFFDTRYKGSAVLEETDFSYRLRRITGKKIIFNPQAVLLHIPQKDGNEALKASKQIEFYHCYFHNLVLFFLKNMPFYSYPFCFVRLVLLSLYHGILQKKSISSFLYLLKGIKEGFSSYIKGF